MIGVVQAGSEQIVHAGIDDYELLGRAMLGIVDPGHHNTGIAGDGYGYVSSSSFWAGRKGEPRLWTADAAALAIAALLLFVMRSVRALALILVPVGSGALVGIAAPEFGERGRDPPARAL